MALKLNKNKNNHKIEFINILRIIACLLVIVNHTSIFLLNYRIRGINIFYCFVFSICKIGVPIFIMISGYLLLSKKSNYKKIMIKIFKICSNIIIVSTLFYLLCEQKENKNFLDFIQTIYLNPYPRPLWYLYMLIGLYMCTPFLQKMIKKFNNKDYLIFVVFFLIIPSLTDLINTLLNMKISSTLFLGTFTSAIGYYVMGSYFNRIKNSKSFFIIFIIFFIIGFSGMFLSMYIPFKTKGIISYSLDSWNTLPIITMAISFFYIVKYIITNIKLNKHLNSITCVVSSTTFGIYLIHLLIYEKIYSLKFIKYIYEFSPFLGFIFLVLFIFIICGIMTFIFKMNSILKKLF